MECEKTEDKGKKLKDQKKQAKKTFSIYRMR